MSDTTHTSTSSVSGRLLRWLKGIDWVLVLLLFIVTNQAMLLLKLAGLALVFLLRPNLRFRLGNGRLPLFYVLIPVVGVLSLLFRSRDFSGAYLVALSLATAYWLAALFCSHQLRLSIEKRGIDAVDRTLRIFSFVNLGASLFQLARIMVHTGTLNPYVHLDFPYGMSTGDNIYGAFMQLSYCNMMVSTFLCLYFLHRRNLWASLAACTSLLLVFGNIGNLVFAFIILLQLLLFLSARIFPRYFREGLLERITPKPGTGKIFIGIGILFAVFYGIVSADNLSYTSRKLAEKVEQVGEPETATQAQEEKIETDRFKALKFDQYLVRPYRQDTQDYRRRVEFTQLALSEYEGKRVAFRETRAFLRLSPATMLFGAGPVRFSSLTAQRMSGLDSSRIFRTVLPRFVAPEFHDNHRLLSVERITAPSAQFSNSNWPDSFYNQILGEYGLLGLAVFLFGYVWFFLRQWRRLSYGIWIAATLIPFALLSYLFEPLCVTLFFELLLYLDIAMNDRRDRTPQYV